MMRFQVVGLAALILSSAILADEEFNDQSCKARWASSSAYATCTPFGNGVVAMDFRDKRTYDPTPMSKSYDYDKGEPIKFCSVSMDCLAKGTEEKATGLAAGHTQTVSKRKLDTYVFRWDSLKLINNCDGTLQLSPCS